MHSGSYSVINWVQGTAIASSCKAQFILTYSGLKLIIINLNRYCQATPFIYPRKILNLTYQDEWRLVGIWYICCGQWPAALLGGEEDGL